MKIAVLSTGTNNVPPIINPLRDLGHELNIIVYDALADQTTLPALVKDIDPDWVLYVGALPGHHSKPVPGVDILAAIGMAYKMVHLCFDGAEPYWWRTLDEYYARGRFSLQVNIDGMRTGPIGDRGLTMLCPVDVDAFRNPAWDERPNLCGFSGGLHAATNRVELMGQLTGRGLVTYRCRDQSDDGNYDLYRRFLESCKVGINFAGTGGGIGGTMHVKHRAGGELPAAGCLVLETKGSPLADWFVPGQDYLEYANANEAETAINWVKGNLVEAQAMAGRMRAKVAQRHTPAVFWSQVMERLGFGEALYPAAEVPHKAWGFDPQLPAGALLSVNGAPRLLASDGPCNVVSYGNVFFVVPKMLGPLDLVNANDRNRPGIEQYGTMQEAMAAASRAVQSQSAESQRRIVPQVAPPPRPMTAMPRLRTGAQRRGAIG